MADVMSDSNELSVFVEQGLSEDQAKVCAYIAIGKPIKKAQELAGITEYRYMKWMLMPAFARAVQCARTILTDRLLGDTEELLFSMSDQQRLANVLKHRHWMASKLIPKVYGDKLDVNVTQTIDIGSALAEARARAASVRPTCDPADIIDVQVIDSQAQDDRGQIDNESTAPLPDIFD